MNFFATHIYIFLSIIFAVSSQLIIKWKMNSFSIDNIGEGILDKFIFATTMLFNPYIMLSIIFTLLSGLSWMIAMTKFDISYAYPFTTLGYVLILLLSWLLFGEDINIYKVSGIIFIIIGIYLSSKSL
jgi:multidrug transporter EmrE-like cation transporter